MMSLNSAYVEDLYFQYLRDPETVSSDWKSYFEQHSAEIIQQMQEEGRALPSSFTDSVAVPLVSSNGTPAAKTVETSAPNEAPARNSVRETAAESAPAPAPAVAPVPAIVRESKIQLGPNDKPQTLSGVAERIVGNMESSLQLPTATSLRSIPVKVLDENRKLLNHFLAKNGKRKVSFTHIIAWALVRSLVKYPGMNDAFAYINGKPTRVQRGSVNLGLAADVTRKDGTRSLVVPSVKDAQNMNFAQFVKEYDSLINKARNNKLEINDLMGATATLTNPGGIGTIASIPRLMEGQGVIIATGAIDYPPEFRAVSPEVLGTLAVSKVMGMTSTYDHRIIQGAESGEFLAYMETLLLGGEHFYEQVFASYNIPFEPFRWSVDNSVNPFGARTQEHSLEKEAKLIQLINAYRVRGHLYANVNPLGLQAYYYPELEPSFYGFTIWDLDREFDTGGLGGVSRATLRDILTMLRETYCDKIGVEFMHIQSPEKKQWVRSRIEPTHNQQQYSREQRIEIFRKLVESESFEKFLGKKFIGAKRFSLEGGEALVPMLDGILGRSLQMGVRDVFMGMAHRGRLNVLVNIIGKSAERIFREFQGALDPESSFHGTGDVKYHLGAVGTYNRPSIEGELRVTLAPNPSHLEAVNPVVEGMARGMVDYLQDRKFERVLPVLIHGDAAFAGQGVVQETLNLSNLRGYRTGGTIHIVINNQIGFTTPPDESRSTTYATDIAKMLQVPILHVNGGDPEAVMTAALFALEYRMTFNEDVVIDMICYRKFGHNEADEPAFTQPLMYKKIRALPAYSATYRDRLVEEKVLTSEQADAIYSEVNNKLEEAFAQRPVEQPQIKRETIPPQDVFAPVHTAVDEAVLRDIAQSITKLPDGFALHPKLGDLLERRREMVFENKGTDWAMGEALAFGSLLKESHSIRLSGQDSARGTFSQRHAVLVDQASEREYLPLSTLCPAPHVQFNVYDSSLSEYGVMGFDYGYSVLRKDVLTLWEAQFGDFMNGAQIMIDQFISSAETKWGQTSGLVLLLPHGYEGQGPEHSSARLERFLVLCAENNMYVCNLSTSAQYFHALRRQIVREFKKPLVLMTPKSLLRLPSSSMDEFTNGHFQEVIDDASIRNPESVRRVLFCTGKMYFDLVEKRKALNIDDVAIVRLEQIYPFHAERVQEILRKYGQTKEVVWVQEEPKNMGAWFFVQPRLGELLSINQTLKYIGRRETASPATGYGKVHEQEQEAIKIAAFAQF